MYKSDYSLRKILKVAFKTSSFLNSNFAVPVWQLREMSVMILELQLQSILEWTQNFTTTDQIMKMTNIFVAIVHTHIRPYLHS